MVNWEEIIAIVIIVCLIVGIILYRVWYINNLYKTHIKKNDDN